MHNIQTILNRLFWMSLATAIVMGCGGKASEFKQTAGEMKEGPGVLTGEEGAFVIYDDKKGGPSGNTPKRNLKKRPKKNLGKLLNRPTKKPRWLRTRPPKHPKPE
jgi:hypothetical protein